ncbi:MAG TPA: class I SAM-dependent methyltransferase [Candidatus Dormibacteraeota bacterium]|jgi:SAM-dependent methyltransferase|nr:class I SAM-dependent methyltransferase [Candidatus Dormibacteraeota bacterium]
MAKTWMIDELAHAGPEHLDQSFIAGYDRKQGHPDPAGDIEALRERGAGERSTVIDIGAGTGQFSLAAARAFGRVVAVDVSRPMLDLLGSRAAEAGLTNLECAQAGFLSYRHQGEPADAVFTRNALHHLPDFWKGIALNRIRAMLRPGGVLRLRDLVFDLSPADAEPRIDHWVENASPDAEAGYTGEDYAEHVRTEFSTYRWLLEPLLTASGFEIAGADFQGAMFGAYTCVRT